MTTTIKAIKTLRAQACEWYATREKFVYCLEALELSAHNQFADNEVDKLEAIYTAILEAGNSPIKSMRA